MVTPLAVLALAVAVQGQGRTDPTVLPRIALGFGVDTSMAPVGDIFRMWRAFLQDRPDSLHPSPHWSRAEQARYRDYVLGRDYLFQGFPNQFPSVTVLTITPAVPGEDSLYVIRTLVGGVYQPEDEIRVLGIFRVYAQRQAKGWALSNAISRVSAGWIREPIGSITFVYPPSRRLDRGRARRSARFADSLAWAFGLPAKPLTYYVADTPEGMFRLQGLDFVPEPSQAGVGAGRADDVNGLVFSGSPVVQEGYRHEIAHVVLAPPQSPEAHAMAGGRRDRHVDRGVAGSLVPGVDARLRVLSQEPLELYPGQRPHRATAGRPRYAVRDRGDPAPARLRTGRHSRRAVAVPRG